MSRDPAASFPVSDAEIVRIPCGDPLCRDRVNSFLGLFVQRPGEFHVRILAQRSRHFCRVLRRPELGEVLSRTLVERACAFLSRILCGEILQIPSKDAFCLSLPLGRDLGRGILVVRCRELFSRIPVQGAANSFKGYCAEIRWVPGSLCRDPVGAFVQSSWIHGSLSRDHPFQDPCAEIVTSVWRPPSCVHEGSLCGDPVNVWNGPFYRDPGGDLFGVLRARGCEFLQYLLPNDRLCR